VTPSTPREAVMLHSGAATFVTPSTLLICKAVRLSKGHPYIWTCAHISACSPSRTAVAHMSVRAAIRSRSWPPEGRSSVDADSQGHWTWAGGEDALHGLEGFAALGILWFRATAEPMTCIPTVVAEHWPPTGLCYCILHLNPELPAGQRGFIEPSRMHIALARGRLPYKAPMPTGAAQDLQEAWRYHVGAASRPCMAGGFGPTTVAA
jgi:hypothetical protein